MVINKYEQILASLLIPDTPNNTVIVYILHISKSTKIVTVVVTSKPNTAPIALVSKGVASEKVVAVAHTTAKIARISINFPKTPSTLSPRRGRQASEKR